ncbi:PTS system ascorbate-specific IIA component [Bacillus sp. SLBN-46]|uniref:BglG family transcription antiterminator n=1 Tax=Bacillus sp. SLBN-46 TaxID=3042283 RepID=UPI00286057E9|nr:BglG family transcription antiterminator [Bacillus sp. SLBN-46]MDR6121212.1 PTS system ascorbate-specific IIA component [Bacillus sp. SLBN-46]
MMIEKRPAQLLNYLIKVKETTINQVIDHTRLTKRQIFYDLDKINHWLKGNGLPPIPFKGIHQIVMPDSVMQYVRKQQMTSQERGFVLNEEERLIFIYLYLFIRKEPISSIHLTQLLQVSKNTVISDVKKANEWNEPFLVKICYTRRQGYHLMGTEFDKRVLVMEHLSKILQEPYGERMIDYLLNRTDYSIPIDSLKSVIKMIEKNYKLHFVEERLTPFTYFLLLYSYRSREKKFVQFHSSEMDVLKQDPMRMVAIQLIQSLHFEEEESEICYLTIQLLGLSLGNGLIPDGDRDLLFKLCLQLVSEFESKACIGFEKKNEVIQSLYQHLKPAYFRMKYRIPITNPLLEQIKSQHRELYTIVKELLLPMETLLGITIPEEEIGFITIHFGALLEKPKKSVRKKKLSLIVCPSGISSSLMVKHQVESLFSEISVEKTLSLQEFHEGNFGAYDLIFSTVALETDIPTYEVKPIMTPIEKNNLVNEVYQQLQGINYHGMTATELIQILEPFVTIHHEKGLRNALSTITFHKKEEVDRRKRPVLRELLTEETIQMADQLSDWEEAIKVAARPLLVKGVIEPSYIEAMIDNVKDLGPYVVIGPEVAVPHARPEKGVNQVGMSFLKLNKPVYFLNNVKYPVRLLFCIAAIDNKTHLTALSQLTKLLSQKDNIDLLKEISVQENFISLFKQYSELD